VHSREFRPEQEVLGSPERGLSSSVFRPFAESAKGGWDEFRFGCRLTHEDATRELGFEGEVVAGFGERVDGEAADS
jgi:hypothetical protein